MTPTTVIRSAVIAGDKLTCPFCAYVSGVGVHVCRGCRADIVYKATLRELRNAMFVGAFVGLVLVVAISEKVNLPSFVAFMLTAGGAFLGVNLRQRSYDGRVRFVRRSFA